MRAAGQRSREVVRHLFKLLHEERVCSRQATTTGNLQGQVHVLQRLSHERHLHRGASLCKEPETLFSYAQREHSSQHEERILLATVLLRSPRKGLRVMDSAGTVTIVFVIAVILHA